MEYLNSDNNVENPEPGYRYWRCKRDPKVIAKYQAKGHELLPGRYLRWWCGELFEVVLLRERVDVTKCHPVR